MTIPSPSQVMLDCCQR